MDNKVYQVSTMLRQAQKHGISCQPIRDYIGSKNIEVAYQIQHLNNQMRLDAGEKLVGKKIGLTSPAVQKQLGVDQPDFGLLFEKMQIEPGDILPFKNLIQPKAEAEIAFILKSDLVDFIDLNSVAKAIDYAVTAIEIVDSRINDWDIQITDTVADNASASHFVLGTQRVQLEEIDLEGCQMKLYKNELLVSEGVGAACLGNPLNALLWLAQTMKNLGQPLKKGEIVLSGALGPMTNIEKGDVIRTSIEGVGNVHFVCG